MTAIISPLRAGRDRVKGLYKKGRAGEIKAFTGISSPYEAPDKPEIVVETGTDPLDKCADQVLGLLRERGILK